MGKTETTTISLPRSIATRARQLSRIESRTMSELFREAFRCYETSHRDHRAHHATMTWNQLRPKLDRIARMGKKQSLSAFVIRDRKMH